MVIDLLPDPVLQPDYDAGLVRECEDRREAALISGEIIVCRRIGDDVELSGFDSEAAARRYAERSQGPRTPDVEGAGGSILYRGEGSVFLITTGKIKVGSTGEGPLLIDVESLPEAPEGSDADRVGKGLPVERDSADRDSP